ncbi:hypothetical protein EOM09_03925 [bacterium]|nr:hypothetical protein [bacterium]
MKEFSKYLSLIGIITSIYQTNLYGQDSFDFSFKAKSEGTEISNCNYKAKEFEKASFRCRGEYETDLGIISTQIRKNSNNEPEVYFSFSNSNPILNGETSFGKFKLEKQINPFSPKPQSFEELDEIESWRNFYFESSRDFLPIPFKISASAQNSSDAKVLAKKIAFNYDIDTLKLNGTIHPQNLNNPIKINFEYDFNESLKGFNLRFESDSISTLTRIKTPTLKIPLLEGKKLDLSPSFYMGTIHNDISEIETRFMEPFYGLDLSLKYSKTSLFYRNTPYEDKLSLEQRFKFAKIDFKLGFERREETWFRNALNNRTRETNKISLGIARLDLVYGVQRNVNLDRETNNEFVSIEFPFIGSSKLGIDFTNFREEKKEDRNQFGLRLILDF